MSVTFSAYVETEEGLRWTDTNPNFANGNARMILQYLGIETDELVGSVPVEELLAKCVLARAIGGGLDDSGFASSRHGNLIDCGLRPGYFADAVAQIEEVCYEAQLIGADVVGFA